MVLGSEKAGAKSTMSLQPSSMTSCQRQKSYRDRAAYYVIVIFWPSTWDIWFPNLIHAFDLEV